MDSNMAIINVSGKEYKIRRNILNNLPDDILKKATTTTTSFSRNKIDEFHFDRHSDSFEAILWYYTNGELHMPVNVCPAVFDKELRFWNIEAEKLSKCCFLRYISFFQDQKLLKSFTTGEHKSDDLQSSRNVQYSSKWKRIQKKGWKILDDPTSSIWAKWYVTVSALVILTSIFVLCASTHPGFQRELYLKEWKKYFEGDSEAVKQILRCETHSNGISRCFPKTFDSKPEHSRSRENIETTVKSSTYTISETEATYLPTSEYSDAGRYVASVSEIATYNESSDLKVIHDVLSNRTSRNNYTRFADININYWRPMSIRFPSNTHARYKYLDYIDSCTVLYFALELLIRFLFCPQKFKFPFEFLNIVDIIAFLSECITIFLEYSFPKEKFDDYSPLDVIECIQILRVFRVFRTLKYSLGFRILVYSLRESISNMAMMTFLLFIATLFFASVEYYCDRVSFSSIPDAIWWAIITMTTVGYGDKSPTSYLGKAVGSLCAISGVFVLALLIPVLVNNFILFIGFSKIHGKKPESSDTNKEQGAQRAFHFITQDDTETLNMHNV